jgi:hypothetical protein
MTHYRSGIYSAKEFIRQNNMSQCSIISEQFISLVGFEVLSAVSMMIAVFWVVAPCSLVEVYS